MDIFFLEIFLERRQFRYNIGTLLFDNECFKDTVGLELEGLESGKI